MEVDNDNFALDIRKQNLDLKFSNFQINPIKVQNFMCGKDGPLTYQGLGQSLIWEQVEQNDSFSVVVRSIVSNLEYYTTDNWLALSHAAYNNSLYIITPQIVLSRFAKK